MTANSACPEGTTHSRGSRSTTSSPVRTTNRSVHRCRSSWHSCCRTPERYFSTDTLATAHAQILCPTFTTIPKYYGSTLSANVSVVLPLDLPVPNVFYSTSFAIVFNISFSPLSCWASTCNCLTSCNAICDVMFSFATFSFNVLLQPCLH